MIRIEFSAEDIRNIKRLRYEHPHARVRQRLEVLWLKSQDLPHKDICRLAGISSNTLRDYLRKFQSGGVKGLTELNGAMLDAGVSAGADGGLEGGAPLLTMWLSRPKAATRGAPCATVQASR